jgi:hypothetical protein
MTSVSNNPGSNEKQWEEMAGNTRNSQNESISDKPRNIKSKMQDSAEGNKFKKELTAKESNEKQLDEMNANIKNSQNSSTADMARNVKSRSLPKPFGIE